MDWHGVPYSIRRDLIRGFRQGGTHIDITTINKRRHDNIISYGWNSGVITLTTQVEEYTMIRLQQSDLGGSFTINIFYWFIWRIRLYPGNNNEHHRTIWILRLPFSGLIGIGFPTKLQRIFDNTKT